MTRDPCLTRRRQRLTDEQHRKFARYGSQPIGRECEHSGVPILGAFYSVPIMGAMEKSVHTEAYAALRAELRAMRASAGLSQRDLAARLKVPHSWIAKVEVGERRIDVIELCWFILACGAEPLSVLSRLVPKIRRLDPVYREKQRRVE